MRDLGRPAAWVSPMEPSDAELIDGRAERRADWLGALQHHPFGGGFDSADALRIVAKYSIGCEDVDVEAATRVVSL